MTASIGLAVHEPGQDGEALLDEADRAMYAAKPGFRLDTIGLDESDGVRLSTIGPVAPGRVPVIPIGNGYTCKSSRATQTVPFGRVATAAPSTMTLDLPARHRRGLGAPDHQDQSSVRHWSMTPELSQGRRIVGAKHGVVSRRIQTCQ